MEFGRIVVGVDGSPAAAAALRWAGDAVRDGGEVVRRSRDGEGARRPGDSLGGDRAGDVS